MYLNLKEKIRLYQEYDIKPYCGGTLFEKCYLQNKIGEYLQWIEDLGIETIEVSNGTVDIPLEERLELISQLKNRVHIIAEVGSKDSTSEMDIAEWSREIQLLLRAGCQYVITEGRDSGTAGIYDSDGKVKSSLIQELLQDIDYKKIIFEAPTHKHQMFFINMIGANVNLGNVKLSDILVLEAQRCGLRSETLHLEEREWKLPL